MTISSIISRVVITGNGVTTAFPVSFPFHTDSDLVVVSTVIATGVATVQNIPTHYSVSGTPDAQGHYPNGGTVDFVVAPPDTVDITIYRDPALTQDLDLVDNDGLPAESLESTLDYLTMLLQRLDDRLGRTLRQPDGDGDALNELPTEVDRASTYLAFDADGQPVATTGTTSDLIATAFIETLLDDANAAAARATLEVPAATSGTLTTPSIEGLLTLTGGQVAFPATQVPSAGANVLDDYEEGTWTPSLGGSASYTAQLGTYTKIGRKVYVNCRLTVALIGTGNTRVISGLPFTASGSHPGACSAFASVATGVVGIFPVVISGTTTIDMLSLTAAATATGTSAIFGNSTDVFVSATYTV